MSTETHVHWVRSGRAGSGPKTVCGKWEWAELPEERRSWVSYRRVTCPECREKLDAMLAKRKAEPPVKYRGDGPMPV